MSYLVLARKWRPQKFEDIVGQEFVRKTLQNAISSDRVAHSFLFTGARGVGKTSTARILAKSLNCVKGPTMTPCNVCDNCVEIVDGKSVDVLEIDGASNRGIDEVRELRENIKYFPSKSKYKIFIIDEVHMLTKEAFNALLKTLEEPPAHAIFIFATTEPHKIPITILSRCQRFDFKKISLKDISAHLRSILDAEKIKVSDSALMQISKAANGSMRDSQSILDQIISYCGNEISDSDVNDILGIIDRSIIYSLVGAIIDKDAGAAFQVINSMYNYGYDINQFCFNILETFRDIIAFKVSEKPKEVIELSDGELSEIKRFADRIDENELLLMFNILYKAEEDITKSLTPKILLEMSVMRMINRFPVMPLAGLMKKLVALESAFAHSSKDAFAHYSKDAVAHSSKDAVVHSSKDAVAHSSKINKAVTQVRPAMEDDSAENIDIPHSGAKNKQGFLEYLRNQSIILYSHVEPLLNFDVTDGEIIIEAENVYSQEYFESKDVQMDLEKLANNYFEKKLTIIIKKVEKTDKNSLYSNNELKSKAPSGGTNKKVIYELENSDPIFEEVKRLFDGDIIDVKTST